MPNTIKVLTSKKILINNIPHIKINSTIEYRKYITYKNNNYVMA